MPVSPSPGGTGATSSSGPEQNNKPFTTPSQNLPSRLERLPLELRQQIYTYVFADNNASIDVTVRLGSDSRPRSSAFAAFRNLLLTNSHVSFDVRNYFFSSHCFRFVDCDDGSSGPIAEFWLDIGNLNVSLIRRISLPLYSVGLFANVDCAVGNWRLWSTSYMLQRFTGLTHLDLGVDMIECFPHSYKLFSAEGAETRKADRGAELERWDWSMQESWFPMRDCFEKVGHSIQDKKVEVSIYWSVLSVPSHRNSTH
jgi:hypothetical protein